MCQQNRFPWFKAPGLLLHRQFQSRIKCTFNTDLLGEPLLSRVGLGLAKGPAQRPHLCTGPVLGLSRNPQIQI